MMQLVKGQELRGEKSRRVYVKERRDGGKWEGAQMKRKLEPRQLETELKKFDKVTVLRMTCLTYSISTS